MRKLVVPSLLLFVVASPSQASERAIELVTQARHETSAPSGAGPGPYPTTGNQGVFLAADDNALLFPSSDPFVGATGTQATFTATRESSGTWRTSSAFPAEATGNYVGFLPIATAAASTDLATVIYTGIARLLPADDDFALDIYLRDAGGLHLLTLDTPDDASLVGQSSDAKHVLFQTTSNLVPGALGTAPKLYEWSSSGVELVGIKPDGSVDPGGSVLGNGVEVQRDSVVGASGATAVFESPAPAEATPENPVQVYVRVDHVTTVAVSASRCTRIDCNAQTDARFQWAVKDGRQVFFSTQQQLVSDDIDNDVDLYRYSLDTSDLARVSAGVGLPDSGQVVLGASVDGQRVYFRGATGLTFWDEGITREIGEPITFPGAVVEPRKGCGSGNPEVTPDGAVLLFDAEGDFVPFGEGDHAPGDGLWRYSSANSSWTHIAPQTRGPLRSSPGGMLGTGQGDCAENRSISDDGAHVFFQTEDRLVSTDINDESDVYEWDVRGLKLLSSGRSAYPSRLISTTPSARDVFFVTFDSLSPFDSDDTFDIYDARVGGVVARGPAPPTPSCVGEECQRENSVAPEFPATSSSGVRGSGAQDASRFIVRRLSDTAIRRLAAGRPLDVYVNIASGGAVTADLSVRRAQRWSVVDKAKVARRTAGLVHLQLSLPSRALLRLARKHQLPVRLDVRFSRSAEPRKISRVLRTGAQS